MKTVLARRLSELSSTAGDLPDDSPASFAACRAGVLADDAEVELRELAEVISGASDAPTVARHAVRGRR